MKIYQSFAAIEDCFGHRASRFSRKVYKSYKEAMSAVPEFLDRLERQDDHDLGYADMIHRISIIELELIEEPTSA